MKAFPAFVSLSLVAMLSLATGCAPKVTYRVEAASHEVIAEKIDAQWFTREIDDEEGVATVELVYCPTLPAQPTVCRSASVWQRDVSALLAKP